MTGHRTYLDPRPHRPTIFVNEELIDRVLKAKRRGYQENVRVPA